MMSQNDQLSDDLLRVSKPLVLSHTADWLIIFCALSLSAIWLIRVGDCVPHQADTREGKAASKSAVETTVGLPGHNIGSQQLGRLLSCQIWLGLRCEEMALMLRFWFKNSSRT